MDISLSEITNLTPIVFRKGEIIEKTNENLPGRESVNGKAAEPPREWIEDIISLGAEMPDGQADVLSGKVPFPEADFFPAAAGEAGSEGAAILLPEDAYTPGPPAGHGETLPVLEGMYTPAGKKILPQQKNNTSPSPAQTGETPRPASGSVPVSELGRSVYKSALSAYAALMSGKAPATAQNTAAMIPPAVNIPAPAEAALPVEPPSDNRPDNTAEFSSGGFGTALPFSADRNTGEALPAGAGAAEGSVTPPTDAGANAQAAASGIQPDSPVPLSNTVLFEAAPSVPADVSGTQGAAQGAEAQAVPETVLPQAAPETAQTAVSGEQTIPQFFGKGNVQNDPLLSALMMDDTAAYSWLEGEAAAPTPPPAAGMAQELFAGVKHAAPLPSAPPPAAQLSATAAMEAQPSEILLRNIKLNAGGAYLSALMRDASVFAPEVVREQNKKHTKELPYSLYLFGGESPERLIIADEEYEDDELNAEGGSAEADYLRVGDAVKMASVVHNLYWGERSAFLEGKPWYQVYVDYALMHHIISEGEYSDPAEFVTRAEMASIFACSVPRSELAPKSNLPPPSDVPFGRSRDLILLLLRAGVLAKRAAGSVFNPDGYVSRTEASVIMGRIVNPALRK